MVAGTAEVTIVRCSLLFRPWVGLTLLSMSRMIIFGGWRS